MQTFKKLLVWLWKKFWSLPVWVKIAIAFFVMMKIDSTVAVKLILIVACLWAIQHMFRSLIPKKKKKK